MRHTRFLAALLLGLWVGALGAPRGGLAYELLADDTKTLRLSAWGRAGYRVMEPSEGDTEWGPQVQLARLIAAATYRSLGGMMLQLDGSQGAVALMDLFVDVTPTAWLRVRAGLCKTPTSHEFLIPVFLVPFVNRSTVVRFAPRRQIGLEAVGTVPLGTNRLDVHLGLFNPGPVETLGQDGQLLSARLRLVLDFGLQIHAAFADVLGEEGSDALPNYPFRRLVDGAVSIDREDWWLHGEVIKVLDDAARAEPLSATLMAGVRLGRDEGSPVYEPVVGVDTVVDEGSGDLVQIRTGINLYLIDHFLFLLADYEYARQLDDDTHGHAVILQLQGGF